MYSRKGTKTMRKTPKQEIEEIAAIEHDDPTGLYDNISVEGAIIAFVKYLTQKGNLIDEKYEKTQNSVSLDNLTGQKYLIRELLEDLKS